MTITYKDVGLFAHEYEALKDHLKREPSETELYLAGVMWSEHCSYKSTRPLLKQFPNTGKYVLGGEGENAGVVDLGKGYGLAFKVESHNHPSAVEPYQGAATGVGGIIRDILAMGARPVAVMDGLFFGTPEHSETKRIKPGVVHGVGGYGNCVGVPNIGGKTIHHQCYTHNPLVNAFCAGVVKLDNLVSSKTAKEGHIIMALGAATGRDGIAGAAFASVELDQENTDNRPRVQIGDPFAEKQLIECFIELNETGLIASAQDMGAAGVISSSSEVAAGSNIGMKIQLDHVHTREENMTGWEIALSESQERFLLIVEPKNVDKVTEIAHKWEINCSVIGQCYDDGKFELYDRGELVADVAPDIIGGNAPIIPWEAKEPADYGTRQKRAADLTAPSDYTQALIQLLNKPSLKSHEGIYEQYDGMVQCNTIKGAGHQVVQIRVPEADVAVGFVMEADPLKCYVNPKAGAADLIATTVRALAIAGFDAMAITDGINHPSPEKPEQFWELSQNIAGMVDACKNLDCPVVSGNVSLYNEGPKGRIYPSPVIVTTGIKPLNKSSLSEWNMQAGDIIYLVGNDTGGLGGSQYADLAHGKAYGEVHYPNWNNEREFNKIAQYIAHEGLANSGKLVMGGGLLTSLAKLALHNEIGLELNEIYGDKFAYLLGEGGLRAIYIVNPTNADAFEAAFSDSSVKAHKVGSVGGDKLIINGEKPITIEDLKCAVL